MDQTITIEAVTDACQPPETSPGFWTLVKEDWIRSNRDWTRPGFRAVFMYRFGVWRMSIRPRIIRLPFSWLYRVMHRWVRNRYGIELHYTATIGRRFLIAHQGAIVVHEYSIIGDDCTIRQGVTLGSAGPYSDDNHPTLGNNIDVGAGAMILGKVKIGDNVRIGANAVITMSVPPNSLAVAQPARIIPMPASVIEASKEPRP